MSELKINLRQLDTKRGVLKAAAQIIEHGLNGDGTKSGCCHAFQVLYQRVSGTYGPLAGHRRTTVLAAQEQFHALYQPNRWNRYHAPGEQRLSYRYSDSGFWMGPLSRAGQERRITALLTTAATL